MAAFWAAADRVVSSRMLYPEARAALAAAARAGRLRSDGLRRAREELEALWRDVNCIEVTPDLARRAGELAEEHALRGYDAVHLASFEEVAADDGVLAAADDGLLAAARARNLDTFVPY